MTKYQEGAVIRAMKVQEIILRAVSGKITWVDAATIIGVSERTMRRWKWRYNEYGYDGLFDRRRQEPSPKRVPFKIVQRILRLYADEYHDFSVKHFHEQLVSTHNITLSYQWVKTALQTAGLVPISKKRGPHRLRRERRPMRGMMLFCDGSTHQWLPLLRPQKQDLILFCDDATSEVYTAYLVREEGTLTVMSGLKEIIAREGLFCTLYTDRGSHFFYTPKVDGPVDKHHLTQIGRALDRLGIEHIPSYSPQARGRIERMFGTWQKRLPPELRRAGIRTTKEANDYIKDKFMPWFNSKMTVKAKEEGSAFVPAGNVDLDGILCIQHDRIVENDNTVSFNNRRYQIQPSTLRCSFARSQVKVCEHLTGMISIRHGPHVLGRYHPDGQIIEATVEAQGARVFTTQSRK
jgi:transposase